MHDSYNHNVFINCPFDDDYIDLRQILTFTICYFGLTPRISLESSDSGLVRLEKIIQLIKSSKYSIHDLSRLQSQSVGEYYRLNMPFELGIDYGLKRFDADYADKKSLVLEKGKYDYMKAISDINGFDIKNHNNVPEDLISAVRAWLSETVKMPNLNTSTKVYSDYIMFNRWLFQSKMFKYGVNEGMEKAEEYAGNEIDEMTTPEMINAIEEWKAKNLPS